MSTRAALSIKQLSSSLTMAVRGKGLLVNTIKTMAFSIAILLVNMATGMITARLLGPEGRGMQTAMILWPQFLALAATFGIHTALLYHMKKSPKEESALYYSSLILTAAASAVPVLLGVFLVPMWMTSAAPEVVEASRWFMLASPFMLLYFMHNALFRGREEFHLFNRMRYLVPLLTLVLLLLLALTGTLTPFTSGLVYLLPYVPVTLLAIGRAVMLYTPSIPDIRKTWRKVMSYGMGSYGIDLLGNLFLYIDQIILVSLLAPGPFGLYVVAVSLSRMLNIFSASINLVLFPKASSLEPREGAHLTLRVFKLSLAAALMVSLLLMLAAPLVIEVLYGKVFLDSIGVFKLLVLEVVLGGSAIVLGQAFMAAGKPIITTISQAIGIGLAIPMIYWLVPLYGVIGAGWALLIPAVVRLAFVMAAFQLKFRFSLRELVWNGDDTRWCLGLLRSRKLQRTEPSMSEGAD